MTDTIVLKDWDGKSERWIKTYTGVHKVAYSTQDRDIITGTGFFTQTWCCHAGTVLYPSREAALAAS